MSLAALVDVDDVRQLVIGGHAAPWEGDAGRRQQLLGVENACELARRFLNARVDVVLADVLTPETIVTYRKRLTDLMIIGFRISWPEAERRAAQRPRHLTPAELERLHRDEHRYNLSYDHVIDVDHCDATAQTEQVRRLWT